MNREHDRNQVKEIYKKRKKAKRIKKTRVFLVLLIIGLIIGFFVSGYSRIQSIVVKGNIYISTEEIIEQCGVEKQKNIALFTKTEDIKNSVENIPGIKEANVTKSLLGDVSITVIENEVLAYQVTKDLYTLVNDSGEMINVDKETGLKEVSAATLLHDFDEELLKTFSIEYAKLPSQVTGIVSDAFYKPEPGDQTRVELHLDNGVIFIVRIEDMASQLQGDTMSKLQSDYPDGKMFDLNGKYSYVTE